MIARTPDRAGIRSGCAGVDDVGWTRQHLDGRPLEPMPGVVQDADGNAGVNVRGTRNRRTVETIAERAREQHELVPGGGCGELCLKGRGQAVNVFADTGALAKRRTIVQ